MTHVYHIDLDCDYASLEAKFNSFRTPENLAYCATSDWWDSEFLTPVPITGVFKVDGSSTQRVVVYLPDGYAVKMRPKGQLDGKFHCIFCSPNEFRIKKPDHVGFQEEGNSELLKRYGFSSEHGFYLPKHKVIGLEIEDNLVKVNPSGVGFSITDDISEDGKYEVTDVKSYFFLGLDNKVELFESYKGHVAALLDFYHNPHISSSIKRHGNVLNPIQPLSRMLLVRTFDNKGEIVIADLDNILFEEK